MHATSRSGNVVPAGGGRSRKVKASLCLKKERERARWLFTGLGKGRAVLGTPGWFYFPSASQLPLTMSSELGPGPVLLTRPPTSPTAPEPPDGPRPSQTAGPGRTLPGGDRGAAAADWGVLGPPLPAGAGGQRGERFPCPFRPFPSLGSGVREGPRSLSSITLCIEWGGCTEWGRGPGRQLHQRPW